MKRKAEEEDAPLRQIFNDVSRSAGEAAEHVSFAELESTMYKRRRRARPQLPSSPSDADAIVRNSRYAELDGGTFYRGLVARVATPPLSLYRCVPRALAGS